ncbi:MAG TPA: hypothetical protein VIC60_13900, partial [Thermomicrobiales bacterium]
LGLPVKLSETPGTIYRIPPLFGQHTDEILREIGVTEAELEQLRASGVINSGAASARAAATGSDMPGKEAT